MFEILYLTYIYGPYMRCMDIFFTWCIWGFCLVYIGQWPPQVSWSEQIGYLLPGSLFFTLRSSHLVFHPCTDFCSKLVNPLAWTIDSSSDLCNSRACLYVCAFLCGLNCFESKFHPFFFIDYFSFCWSGSQLVVRVWHQWCIWEETSPVH